MRVDDRIGAQNLTKAGKASLRQSSAGAFAVAGEAVATSEQSKSASVTTPQGISALFELQMVENSPKESRKRAVRRGHKLLDRLDHLKAALLIGADQDADWDALLAEFQVPRDPNLPKEVAMLLDEVDVRVAVELAKRGR